MISNIRLALFTAKYFQSKTYYALDEQSLLKTAQIIKKTEEHSLTKPTASKLIRKHNVICACLSKIQANICRWLDMTKIL